jgi:hypothetical protein
MTRTFYCRSRIKVKIDKRKNLTPQDYDGTHIPAGETYENPANGSVCEKRILRRNGKLVTIQLQPRNGGMGKPGTAVPGERENLTRVP